MPPLSFVTSTSFARPADVPVLRAPGLGPLALTVIASHTAFLAMAHWLLYQQFLGRAMPDLHASLAAAFRGYTARTFAIELIALATAAAAVAAIRALAGLGRPPHRGDGAAMLATGLAACLPVALFSLGTIVALTFGWEPDVVIMSAAAATDPQVSATIQEALPIVLQQLVIGRQAATIAAGVTFAILLRRLCGMGTRQAVLAAAAAATAAVGVHLVMLGVPSI